MRISSSILHLPDFPTPPEDKSGWPWTLEIPHYPPTMPDGTPWPKISIVTPSFNQAQFIEETIRSVLLQGYPNLEYFIIDGGSTDGSVEIIKKYEPWLTYWVSEPDRGQSHAINKGLERITGNIIAYLNSDDIYLPNTFLDCVKSFLKCNFPGAIVGRFISIDQSTTFGQISQKPFINSKTSTDLSLMTPDQWFLPQPSSFWSSDCLEHVGRYFREDLHFTMDRELFYRISKSYKIVLIDEVLAGFRFHSESKSMSQTLKMYREDIKALKYCDNGNVSERNIRKRNAKIWLARGHYSYGKRNRKSVVGIFHVILAAYYRPDYLLNKSYYRVLYHTTFG